MVDHLDTAEFHRLVACVRRTDPATAEKLDGLAKAVLSAPKGMARMKAGIAFREFAGTKRVMKLLVKSCPDDLIAWNVITTKHMVKEGREMIKRFSALGAT